MELERIGIALRPRAPREAMDLGAALLRGHAAAVWSAWFAFSLPVVVAVNALGVLLGKPWLGLLLTWWLKPLFDRVPLFVLSRAVFDHAPRWREALHGQRALPWAPTLVALSGLRVDSHRALRLPLVLLEGAPRKQRAARWRVLRRKLVGEASMLTYGCLQFELVAFFSLCTLLLWLVPHEWRPLSLFANFSHGEHGAATGWWLAVAALGYLAISAIEPLYVACGFALYLNRRTQLEAWDIELAFRRLRARLQDAGKALALLLCVSWPLHARAATTPPAPAPVVTPQQVFARNEAAPDARYAAAAAQAYRDPRFGGEHKTRRWVLRHPGKPAPRPVHASAPLAMLSSLFNALLWLALAAAVVALGWFAWRWRSRWQVARMTAEPLPEPVAQAVVASTPAPLPRDITVAARSLWQAGSRREALALLYRACVERIALQLQLPPATDATEADWLRHAAALEDAARTRRASAIVRSWQFAAYANRYPDSAVFERLLEGWPAQPEAGA